MTGGATFGGAGGVGGPASPLCCSGPIPSERTAAARVERRRLGGMKWGCAMLAAALVGCADRAPEPGSSAGKKEANAPSAVAPLPAREAGSKTRSFAEFRPSQHGFAFTNDFKGDALGGMGASLGMPSRFGLCGGMSFAAADYYLAAKAVPPDTRPPVQGTSLYNYIYARQAASNGFLGSMGIKFVEWMQLPDDEVRRRTADELPAIAAALEGERLPLLTRDARRYRSYFPNVTLIAPDEA